MNIKFCFLSQIRQMFCMDMHGAQLNPSGNIALMFFNCFALHFVIKTEIMSIIMFFFLLHMNLLQRIKVKTSWATFSKELKATCKTSGKSI